MEATKFKRCKQCGEVKDVNQFRKYYGQNTNSRYKLCLTCEKINNRYKYLSKKASLSHGDTLEKVSIEELYNLQRERGLKPPGTTKVNAHEETMDLIQSELKRQSELLDAATQERTHLIYADNAVEGMFVADNNEKVQILDTPEDLQFWLEEDLSKYDVEYLQNEIVDELLAKYKPQIGVDQLNFRPIFDEKYREPLTAVFKRFDDYEEVVYDND